MTCRRGRAARWNGSTLFRGGLAVAPWGPLAGRAASHGESPGLDLQRPCRITSITHDASEGGGVVTYCLGVMTRQGLVLASDSRTNADYDDVDICRKMHNFVVPVERVFILLCSGSPLVDSLRHHPDAGPRLQVQAGRAWRRPHHVRRRARGRRTGAARGRTLDRPNLDATATVTTLSNFILGGPGPRRAASVISDLPQATPCRAAEESPYPQVGECKYGRARSSTAASATPDRTFARGGRRHTPWMGFDPTMAQRDSRAARSTWSASPTAVTTCASRAAAGPARTTGPAGDPGAVGAGPPQVGAGVAAGAVR